MVLSYHYNITIDSLENVTVYSSNSSSNMNSSSSSSSSMNSSLNSSLNSSIQYSTVLTGLLKPYAFSDPFRVVHYLK